MKRLLVAVLLTFGLFWPSQGLGQPNPDSTQLKATSGYETPLLGAILSWGFVAFCVSGLVLAIRGSSQGIKREGLIEALLFLVFVLWLFPGLYILWLFVVFLTYPFQAVETLLSPVTYIQVAVCFFALFVTIGIAAAPMWIAQKVLAKPVSRIKRRSIRKALGWVLLIPLTAFGFAIFFRVWTRASSVVQFCVQPEPLIRATNGPAWAFYRIGAHWRFPPWLFPFWLKEIHADVDESYRGHVVSLYFTYPEHEAYLEKVHPSAFLRDVHIVAGVDWRVPSRHGPLAYDERQVQEVFVRDLKEVLILSCDSQPASGCPVLTAGSEYAARREGLHLLVKKKELLENIDDPLSDQAEDLSIAPQTPFEKKLDEMYRGLRGSNFSGKGNEYLPPDTPVLKYDVKDAWPDVGSWSPHRRLQTPQPVAHPSSPEGGKVTLSDPAPRGQERPWEGAWGQVCIL